MNPEENQYFIDYVLIFFIMFVKILLHLDLHGGVGEVVNTLVCGTSIHGFDSHTPPHREFYTKICVIN